MQTGIVISVVAPGYRATGQCVLLPRELIELATAKKVGIVELRRSFRRAYEGVIKEDVAVFVREYVENRHCRIVARGRVVGAVPVDQTLYHPFLIRREIRWRSARPQIGRPQIF